MNQLTFLRTYHTVLLLTVANICLLESRVYHSFNGFQFFRYTGLIYQSRVAETVGRILQSEREQCDFSALGSSTIVLHALRSRSVAMQRRLGRGGRGTRPAPAAPSAFGASGGQDSGSSSDDDRGVSDKGAGTPAALVAAAAAAAAVRASKRAARRGDDEGAIGFEEKEAGEGGAKGQEDPRRDAPRESRYIEKLVRQAAVRKDVAEAAFERKLAREREKDDALYEGKERFVTAGYKEKLAQRVRAEQDGDEPTARAPAAGGVDWELGKRLLEAQKGVGGGGAGEDVARRAKRRRWGEVPAAGTVRVEKKAEDEKPVKPLRGLRRNDAAAIEAYRQRYFARRDAAAAKASGGSAIT